MRYSVTASDDTIYAASGAYSAGNAAGTPVSRWGAAAGEVSTLSADDRVFITEYAPDFSSTDLLELISGTPGAVVATVRGIPFSLVRVR